MPGILGLILILAGIGVVVFFDNRLRDWVVFLAATLAGVLLVISFATGAFAQLEIRTARGRHVNF